jgi:hypothetical protein
MSDHAVIRLEKTKFTSANLKIEWANKHIDHLRLIIQQLPTLDKYHVAIERDPQSRQYLLKFRGADYIPIEIPLMIGDIIHNLRSALDHAATVIVGGQSTTIYFPFHQRMENFVRCPNVRAIEQACPGLGQRMVTELEPYEGGRGGLWPLTKLDAIDKHKLIVTAIGVTHIWCERFSDENNNVFHDTILRVRNGAILPPIGFEIKPKIDGKIKPSIDGFFGQGTFFDGEPVIPTLFNLSQAVSEAVSAIAQFVADAGGIIGRDPNHRAAS